jgi:AAA+ superfamily predicted ATPase
MAAIAYPRVHRPEILGYFSHLDILLKEAVARARTLYHAGQEEEQFRGLYISEQEIDSLLKRAPGAETVGFAPLSGELLQVCESFPAIETLSRNHEFTAFDRAVMLLALAPEVDFRYERIFAYLQDDITRRKPTVDLALNLFAGGPSDRITRRARFVANAPLVSSGVLRLVADPSHVDPPLLAYYLRLEEWAVRWLLGDERPDPRLASFCEIANAVAGPELNSDALRRLPIFVSRVRGDGRPVRLLLTGPAASSKRQAARAIAAAERLPLVAADLTRTELWRSDPIGTALLLTRQASRGNAVLHIEGLDNSGEPGPVRPFLEAILAYPGIITLAAATAATAAAAGSQRFLSIEFALPDFDTRQSLWRKAIKDAGMVVDKATITTLASQFELSAEQITAAADAARRHLEWSATSTAHKMPQDAATELAAAARGHNGVELASLTTLVRPVYRWADIVLPDDCITQLKEICQRVAYRHEVLDNGGFGGKLSAGKGVAVLFAGPSGTGKSMAAEVIASELGLNLYRIDLSTVVSKWVGETEKHLAQIFAAAERCNAVLLFEEADALFGKRSEIRDAHDRYANIEVSYLLQKMEQYEGVAILTTNLRGNLDEAFLRRLTFTVHFPFPDEVYRLRIWQNIWPIQTQLDPEVNLEALARLNLSGGNIKNIALATAFLAAAESRAVNMGHLLHAARREYEKAGKVLSTAELEAAAGLDTAEGRSC